MLFDELLDAYDFEKAVESLCLELRERCDLPSIHQLGLVVPCVEEGARQLEQRGIGPFFIAAGAPVFWKEKGSFKPFEGKMGLAYHRGVQLELLEPGSGSDFYARAVDASGRILVHHLGFLVRDTDKDAARLSEMGYPVWVRGRILSLPLIIDFAYMDTLSQTGFIVEFLTWRFLGLRFTPRPALFHTLGRLEKWSGKRSLSL
jgi:hypothetical protein